MTRTQSGTGSKKVSGNWAGGWAIKRPEQAFFEANVHFENLLFCDSFTHKTIFSRQLFGKLMPEI